MAIAQLWTELTALFPNEYLRGLLLFISLFIVTRVGYFFFEKIFLKLSKKTKTTLDDKLFENIRSIVSFFLIVISAKAGLMLITSLNEVGIILDYTINSLIIIAISIAIIRVFDILIDHWGVKWAKKTKSKLDDSLISLFHKFSKITFFIFAFILVLSEWNIDVTGFIAGLGVAGLAIGFAVKDSLANIFGGVSLILDKAVKVHDTVQLDSGESGEVIEVGLRSTRIRTWDNELIIVPNGVLSNAKITNWKLPNLNARVLVPFGVEYGTKVDDVRKVVLELFKKDKLVMKNPLPTIHFLEMGDSSLNMRVAFWIEDVGNRFGKKIEYTEKIYDALNKAKISIPFPTQTIHLEK